MSGNLYAKIDVQLCRRPEMIAVGPLARLLYVQAILYAKEHKTDGNVHQSVLNLVAIDIGKPKLQARKLVEAGLFEETVDGWRIPIDVWRKWNQTRSEIEETAAQKARAGQIGNHERWHSQAEPNPKCELCVEAGWCRKPIAKPSQGATTMSSPETETETETETKDLYSSYQGHQGAVDKSGIDKTITDLSERFRA